MAIVWRKSKIRLKTYTVRKNGCEVVAAKGKIADCNRTIYVIGIYVLPAIRRAALDKYCDTIRCIIEKIKIDDRGPLIVLAGDINRHDIAPAFEDFLDFHYKNTPPTRGDERLDLIYLNDDSCGFECWAVPPLENDVGDQSDHLTLNASLTFPHHHEFSWNTYRTRDMTAANHEKFIKAYTAINWEEMIGDTDDPSAMVIRMQNKVDALTDECFPWRTRKIRSTDNPWIDDHIRRAISRRKRQYKKGQRSVKWKKVKTEMDDMIKKAKREFYDHAAANLHDQGGGVIPYKILKDLAIPDGPKKWSINDLRPTLSDKDLAEELASFFVKITDEFSPLTGEPITTFSNPYELLMPHQVAERIRTDKKPKSAVSSPTN